MTKRMTILGIFLIALLALAESQSPLLITSLPTLKTGVLKGEHFGNTRGKVYVTGRFDVSSDPGVASSEWMQFYDSRPVGQKEVALPDSVIKSWTDTAITIEWPAAAASARTGGVLAVFVKTLRAREYEGYLSDKYPLDSAEYSVELPDGTRSNAK